MLQPSPEETRNSKGEGSFPNCICRYHCLYWPDTGSSQGKNCGSEHDLFYLCVCLRVCFVFVYMSCALYVHGLYAPVYSHRSHKQVLDPSKLMLQAFTECLSCYSVSRLKPQPLKSTPASAIKCYFYCNTIYSTLISLWLRQCHPWAHHVTFKTFIQS